MIPIAYDFDDARRLSFLALGFLKGIRRRQWAELCLEGLRIYKNIDLAILMADWPYIVPPSDKDCIEEIADRYERTFG